MKKKSQKKENKQKSCGAIVDSLLFLELCIDKDIKQKKNDFKKCVTCGASSDTDLIGGHPPSHCGRHLGGIFFVKQT